MGSRYRSPSQEALTNRKNFAKFLGGQMMQPSGPPRTSSSISEGPQYTTNIFDYSYLISQTVNDKSDILQTVNIVTSRDILSVQNGSYVSAYSKNGVENIGQYGESNSGSSGGSIPGGPVSEEFVNSLPLEHPDGSGALIWSRSGKASFEMHLPTSGDIQEDIRNHKQLPDLPAGYKHPFYMDRVGGSQGGAGDFNVGDQDLGTPGAPGAFGSYYGGHLPPEVEQWYCSMAWPFKGCVSEFEKAGREDIAQKARLIDHSAYAKKRVLVYSKKTGLACVCTPGDWGSQPYWTTGAVPFSEGNPDAIKGFYMGIAPDVHQYLGTQHGDEFVFGWMDDNTPLGPYAGGGAQGGESGNNSGVALKNTIEEIKIAGSILLSHPNNRLKESSEFAQLLTEGLPDPGGTKYPYAKIKDSNGNCFLFPSLLNYLWMIFSGGWVLSNYSNSLRSTQKANGSPSYHNYGGGIDIFGLAKEGEATRAPTIAGAKPVYDEFFTFLAHFDPTTKPAEVGCAWEQYYGASNWFKVYKDPNPTHLHLGFHPDSQVGELMPALKRTAGSNTGPR